MTSTFTPSNAIDQSKEKEWPAALGMLDWDTTNIVFTKRSLIEFLKYTGTTVDTNFGNIAKLPRYAKFGKLSEPSGEVPASNEGAASNSNDNETSISTASSGGFKPTRRVREPPGGSHSNIFTPEDEDDALSLAPGRAQAQRDEPVPPAATRQVEEPEHTGIPFGTSVKPTRRVRENPGGKDSLSNFWDEPPAEEFKPTRRVREGPGGRDNISGIF